jgi:hypothetical protein
MDFKGQCPLAYKTQPPMCGAVSHLALHLAVFLCNYSHRYPPDTLSIKRAYRRYGSG